MVYLPRFGLIFDGILWDNNNPHFAIFSGGTHSSQANLELNRESRGYFFQEL